VNLRPFKIKKDGLGTRRGSVIEDNPLNEETGGEDRAKKGTRIIAPSFQTIYNAPNIGLRSGKSKHGGKTTISAIDLFNRTHRVKSTAGGRWETSSWTKSRRHNQRFPRFEGTQCLGRVKMRKSGSNTRRDKWRTRTDFNAKANGREDQRLLVVISKNNLTEQLF